LNIDFIFAEIEVGQRKKNKEAETKKIISNNKTQKITKLLDEIQIKNKSSVKIK